MVRMPALAIRWTWGGDMRFQPVNPNPKLAPRHALFLAATGGGKSQALAKYADGPTARDVVLLWDISGDHAGMHYTTKSAFVRAVRHGLTQNKKSGAGCRIAYAGVATPETWEWFCEVVWSVLDGKRITFVIAEELAAVCRSVNKATPNAAALLNQGRKYGLVFFATSQKPQEVSKTYFDQAAFKVIGQQKGAAMRKRMANEIGVTPAQIAALNPLQFFIDDGTAAEPKVVQFKYKAPTGVKWANTA